MEFDLNVLTRTEKRIFALRTLYSKAGYSPYRMLKFEDYDLYSRNKDFLVSDRVITFTDTNGRLKALKPDVTMSLVRNIKDRPGELQRLYYDENVYRVSGSTHQFKEILQTGLECIGDLDGYDVCEVVTLAAASLATVSENYALDISHMGLLAAVMEASGFSREDQKLAMEYLHRKNYHQLKTLCNDEVSWEKLSQVAACHGGWQELEALAKVLTTPAEQQALAQLRQLWKILEETGCGDSIRLDFSVGNNMGYYSGVVFKGYLEGIPASVLSGGQYDKLPRKMGRKARAIGFAVYLGLLENRSLQEDAFDVDTLIFHDGTADPLELMRASQEAAAVGTVLVTGELPQGRNWKILRQFEKGAWVK